MKLDEIISYYLVIQYSFVLYIIGKNIEQKI